MDAYASGCHTSRVVGVKPGLGKETVVTEMAQDALAVQLTPPSSNPQRHLDTWHVCGIDFLRRIRCRILRMMGHPTHMMPSVCEACRNLLLLCASVRADAPSIGICACVCLRCHAYTGAALLHWRAGPAGHLNSIAVFACLSGICEQLPQWP